MKQIKPIKLKARNILAKYPLNAYVIDHNTDKPIAITEEKLFYQSFKYSEVDEWASFLEKRKIPFTMYMAQSTALRPGTKKYTRYILVADQGLKRSAYKWERY